MFLLKKGQEDLKRPCYNSHQASRAHELIDSPKQTHWKALIRREDSRILRTVRNSHSNGWKDSTWAETAFKWDNSSLHWYLQQNYWQFLLLDRSWKCHSICILYSQNCSLLVLPWLTLQGAKCWTNHTWSFFCACCYSLIVLENRRSYCW